MRPHAIGTVVIVTFAALTGRAVADWTLRSTPSSIDPRANWTRYFATGPSTANGIIGFSTSAAPGTGPNVTGYAIGGTSAYRLQGGGAGGPVAELVAYARTAARNVRVRATLNPVGGFMSTGQHVIVVRSANSASNPGTFVRVNYTNGTLELVRKLVVQGSPVSVLHEVVEASVDVALSSSTSTQIEVLAVKNAIVANLYNADRSVLLGAVEMVDNSPAVGADVYIGGEVAYDSLGVAIPGIDVTFTDVSVVDLLRTTRYTLGNLPTIHWSLPPSSDTGRIAFSTFGVSPTSPAPVRTWIGNASQGGPSLSGFLVRAVADLDQDGGGDAIYHDANSGRVRRLAFNTRLFASTGANESRTSSVTFVPTGWTLAAAADFNGDGDADLVWQNNTNNTVGITTMQRTTATGWIGLSYVPPPYKVVGTADFNMDGNFDLLWQDTTNGAVFIGSMVGTTYSNFRYIGFADPAQWRIAGTFDYNFDDTPDVMWQNTATGELGTWIMNTTGTAVAQWISFASLSDPAWRGAN